MAIDDRHARASETVAQSTSAVLRAKKLVAQLDERKEARGIQTVINKAENSISAVERARELVRRSQELIAQGRKRRQG